jgi:hypothetical protein
MLHDLGQYEGMMSPRTQHRSLETRRKILDSTREIPTESTQRNTLEELLRGWLPAPR